MSALEARAWLTQIDGIGKKTASVLLLFSFGLPLLPIDRHVDRVLRRVGLLAAEGLDRGRPRPGPRHVRARPDVRGARQPHPARPQGLPRPAARPRGLPAAAALPVRGSRRRPEPRCGLRKEKAGPREPAFSRARELRPNWWLLVDDDAAAGDACGLASRCRRDVPFLLSNTTVPPVVRQILIRNLSAAAAVTAVIGGQDEACSR